MLKIINLLIRLTKKLSTVRKRISQRITYIEIKMTTSNNFSVNESFTKTSEVVLKLNTEITFTM